MPLLSIIIPVFNRENEILACINSIVSQSFKDLEIIIQDACSTDNTLSILNQVKRTHVSTPIHIYSEHDRGIFDAMNKAIYKAKGQWIYFIGSDDRLYNNDVLNRVFTRYDYQTKDVLYGNVYSARFNGKYDGEFSTAKILNSNISHQAIFFRKNVFDVVGLFTIKYRSHADWDHNMRWFLSDKIRKQYIDEIIADYADGGYSSTNQDYVFNRNKYYNYLIYGRHVLKLRTKLAFIKMILGGSIQRRDFRLFSKTLVLSPYILI